MMIKVDGMNQQSGNIIAQNLCFITLLYTMNASNRPDTYMQSMDVTSKLTKIEPTTAIQKQTFIYFNS